jgi:hypothetical protein
VSVAHDLKHDILLELLLLEKFFLLVTFVLLHEDSYFGFEVLLSLR